jgi:hypothetical protein
VCGSKYYKKPTKTLPSSCTGNQVSGGKCKVTACCVPKKVCPSDECNIIQKKSNTYCDAGAKTCGQDECCETNPVAISLIVVSGVVVIGIIIAVASSKR